MDFLLFSILSVMNRIKEKSLKNDKEDYIRKGTGENLFLIRSTFTFSFLFYCIFSRDIFS